MILFILFAMIFCHIVDDYYLQGILAKMKQKSWWQSLDNYSDNYKFDYIVALIMHAFSWTFMIMLPIAISLKFDLGWLLILYPINCTIHAIVDDLKANKGKINLVIDQTIHFVQIFITWIIYIAVI